MALRKDAEKLSSAVELRCRSLWHRWHREKPRTIAAEKPTPEHAVIIVGHTRQTLALYWLSTLIGFGGWLIRLFGVWVFRLLSAVVNRTVRACFRGFLPPSSMANCSHCERGGVLVGQELSELSMEPANPETGHNRTALPLCLPCFCWICLVPAYQLWHRLGS